MRIEANRKEYEGIKDYPNYKKNIAIADKCYFLTFM